jgi:hypothetical protein
MQDKVYSDLDNWANPIGERTPVSFETFMYDSMIMRFGLYSISVKVMMQLVNGLQKITMS